MTKTLLASIKSLIGLLGLWRDWIFLLSWSKATLSLKDFSKLFSSLIRFARLWIISAYDRFTPIVPAFSYIIRHAKYNGKTSITYFCPSQYRSQEPSKLNYSSYRWTGQDGYRSLNVVFEPNLQADSYRRHQSSFAKDLAMMIEKILPYFAVRMK